MPTNVIDATVNGPSANSYLTIEEADTLSLQFENGEKWDDLEQEDQCRLLLTGTRLIDRFARGGWGPRELDAQRLAFPRACDDPGVIPEGVKMALMEYVDYRLDGTMTAIKKMQGEGVTSSSLLGQSASFEVDDSGLPAGARRELQKILDATVPTLTKPPECRPRDPNALFD